MRFGFSLLLLLAACGNNSDSQPDAPIVLPDAAPDAYIPGPNAVTLWVGGSPGLVTYRDGKGPWIVPTPDAMSHYNLDVTTTYQVVVACSDASGGFQAQLLDRTFGDGAFQFAFCFLGGTTPSTVAVTGTMQQAGTVDMQDTKTSATAPWSFTLNVAAATHDLVATTSGALVIQRNKVISGATSVGTIDVTANGTPMTALAVTVNGAQATVNKSVVLYTDHDGAQISSTTGSTVYAVPSALLQTGDFQSIDVDEQTGTNADRSAFSTVTGTAMTFTLMPLLTDITYSQTGGVLAATLGTLPTYDTVELAIFGSGTTARYQDVSASKSWLDATGTTQLAFDVAPPGYKGTWQVDLAQPYQRDFIASSAVGTTYYSTSLGEGVNAAVTRAAPMSRRAQLMMTLGDRASLTKAFGDATHRP